VAPVQAQQPVKAPLATAPLTEADLKPLAGGTPAPSAPSAQKQQSPVPTIKSVISLDKLARKYGANDLLTIGRSALNAGNWTEAIFALEALPANNTDTKTRSLLLLEAYIEAGRKKDALFIATSQNIQDAQFDNLCGRLYQSLGKSAQALECFENALTKPSVMRSHSEIRNDALYYSALVRSELYHKDPGADNRGQAANSWNMVKKMYVNNQGNARFKQAEKELLLLQ
jgi:tetratricopeptide (TPR) repeat protein